MSTHFEYTICPWCDTYQDRATNADGKTGRPANGNSTICLDCGQWSVFDSRNSLGLRKMRPAELRRLMKDKKFRDIAEAWRLTNEERKRQATVLHMGKSTARGH